MLAFGEISNFLMNFSIWIVSNSSPSSKVVTNPILSKTGKLLYRYDVYANKCC